MAIPATLSTDAMSDFHEKVIPCAGGDYIHLSFCNGSCGGVCNPDGQYVHQSFCNGSCSGQCNPDGQAASEMHDDAKAPATTGEERVEHDSKDGSVSSPQRMCEECKADISTSRKTDRKGKPITQCLSCWKKAVAKQRGEAERLRKSLEAKELIQPVNISPPSYVSATNICNTGIMTLGKYNGKTFDEIARTDVAYCGWVLGQRTDGNLRQFRDYLVRKLAQ